MHRDFKPTNAMIDPAGRVRVLDFGLAIDAGEVVSGSSDANASRALGGTPLFMAPEQHAGRPASVRSDVYAFSISLWTALCGAHPFARADVDVTIEAMASGELGSPPRSAMAPWLRRVLERGLAPDPALRWPSMHTLLAALERGQLRARRRRVFVGFAVVATAAAVAVSGRQIDQHLRTLACEDAGASIGEVWNDETRASVRAGLVGTGIDYAEVTAEKVGPWLDAQVAGWRAARTEACIETELHANWDADTFDRSLWCLGEARVELEVLLRDLEHADAVMLPTAVTRAAELTPPSACVDVEQLERRLPPPTDQRDEARDIHAELALARARLRAERFDAGLEIVASARTRSEALGWPPMIASAKLLESALLVGASRYADAEAAARSAYYDAARVGAWDVAADSATMLVDIVGFRLDRHDDSAVWGRHAEVAIAHAGDPLGLRHAARIVRVATIHMTKSELAEARALLEEAVLVQEAALGAEHPELATSIDYLATVGRERKDWPAAISNHERALAIRIAAFGPEHPRVAATLSALGWTLRDTGQLAEAIAMLERAEAIYVQAYGGEDLRVAKAMSSRANVLTEMGDKTLASDLHLRALAIFEKVLGPEHRDVGRQLGMLGSSELSFGDLPAARTHLERARAILERSFGPDHPEVGKVLSSLANLFHQSGDHEQMMRSRQSALAIFTKTLGPDSAQAGQELGNIGLFHREQARYAEAKEPLERSVAIFRKIYGSRHPAYAHALTNLATFHLEVGDLPLAIREAEEALAIFAEQGDPTPANQARFTLAVALAKGGKDLERARREARIARDGYASLGDAYAGAAAEVDAWLATHPARRTPTAMRGRP